MQTNPQLETARRYVELTGASIFLTGKAGTGKTTFLRDIVATTAKRHVVLAPTGVAAVNAGGVTIHSFFQLPFDPYLPDVKELVTEYQLPAGLKSLNKVKLNIIRTLELLIIDEISMVRADLLDAIDMVLRRYRRNSRPFGGVQLLMIGDVHQLSPVVTDAEREYMQRVYPTPYFFASKALQRLNYVTIELTTVYRQQDAAFVNLLNHVRDNDIDDATLKALNGRVGIPQKDAITLTTHNRQADAINRRHMESLKGERRIFKAILSGNYPEKSFPCDSALEVIVGERVMFLKNDSSGNHRYYNGKIGTVTGFLYDSETDRDYIHIVDDEGDDITLGRELWESMKYSLDNTTGNITQEVEGTFCQFPLQPAWAVTIHKAQGLTFDRVIINAAEAFAFGQVYVALSRCRTLEGLTLETPLSSSVTFNDTSVSHFVNSRPTFEQTVANGDAYERQYRLEKLMELFGVDDLVHLTERLKEYYGKLNNIYPSKVDAFNTQFSTLLTLQNVSERFKAQLLLLDEEQQDARALKGAEYYHSQLSTFAATLKALLDVEIDNKETAKNIRDRGDSLIEAVEVKLACLSAVKEQGYSVRTVQQAKAKYFINNSDADKRRSRNSSKGRSRDRGKIPGDEQSANADLEKVLRQWRAAKAREEGIPAYMVLQQKALISIATNIPASASEFRQLVGIGPVTYEKYGKEILDLIDEWKYGAV